MSITAVRSDRTLNHPSSNPSADATASPEMVDIIDTLYCATAQSDTTALRFDGCEDLHASASAVALNAPALLGDATGGLLAVLVPGVPTPVEAVEAAVALAREAGINLDPTDPNLVADVSRPRWMILNACESNRHDFHPELAILGPTTPGAALATRVDLLWA